MMAESFAGFGHWRVDYGTGVCRWSPQMYVITGYPADRPITVDTIRSLYHPDDLDRVVDIVDQQIAEGEIHKFRPRMIRPDGRTIHVLLSSQRDGANGLFGILRDTTEEVEAEQSLIAVRDKARAAERTRSEMLTVMSHEIRTPMTGLLSSLDALRGDPPGPQRQKLVDGLAQAAVTVMGVVDDMLDYSHAGAGRIVLESVNFDLKALVRTTADLFAGSAVEKGIGFDVHGIDGDPVMVRADSARVQQLLSNLISNAVKFTDQGSISVSLSPTRSAPDADYWMLIVRDSGRGIEGQALGRIYAHGEQDVARRRVQGQPGLGLAVSQQLAEVMGGSLAMASEPGRGSTFSVELPFAAGTAAASLAESEQVGPLRILMAEDNPINRRLMASLLTRQGHHVVAVEDGRQALGAMATQNFDIVLMDMQMPELDGIEATRAIRALDSPASDTPILAISADSAPDRRRLYFEAGIDSFLPKPVVSAQLLDMLAKTGRIQRAAAAPTGDVFDSERRNLLVEQAGYDDAAILMRMLLTDVAERPLRIATAARARAWELAAAEADALRTLLDGFGSFGLSRLLASIARQCARGECPRAIVDEMIEQARRLSELLNDEIGALPPLNEIAPRSLARS